MRPHPLSVMALACLLFGCATKPPALPAPPTDVLSAYQQLKSSLDPDCPGASIQKLEDFQKQNAKYDLAATVSADVAQLKAAVKDRFSTARDAVRQGQAERAEKIMKDLAQHFPDTDEGRMAQRFLRFDFHLVKANRLMMDRRVDEAEQAVRQVLKADLTAEEREQAERMLDGISHTQLALAMSNAARVQNVCRMLQVLLKVHHAEQGKYPPTLSLADLKLGDSSSQAQVREALSAIEDYKAAGAQFSFVAVGKDGKTRFRVTDAEVKKVD